MATREGDDGRERAREGTHFEGERGGGGKCGEGAAWRTQQASAASSV